MARSDSRSYLVLLDFVFPKGIQIRTDLIGCKETQVRKIYGTERLSATRSKDFKMERRWNVCRSC